MLQFLRTYRSNIRATKQVKLEEIYLICYNAEHFTVWKNLVELSLAHLANEL